ncbi:MAG TPA: hypothetical protein VHK06_01615 [Candidatus Limnocylindria bacterium]|nr:hypothetical protein [Candidatus Limnocylindria bacterium]
MLAASRVLDLRSACTGAAARRPLGAAMVALALLLGACGGEGVSATPAPTSTGAASPVGVASPGDTGAPFASPSATDRSTPSPTASPTPTPAPTARPEPSFSLALPLNHDDRRVAVTVTPEPGAQPARIVLRVTNLADERIAELILRWSEELHAVVYLAPFVATPDRIADGGPPLSTFTDWTRWVLGPGSDGEPPGTVTLGYGPLDPGATLEVPLYVLRRDVAGSVAFDLQLLASQPAEGDPPRRDTLLLLEDGSPAELRVTLP